MKTFIKQALTLSVGAFLWHCSPKTEVKTAMKKQSNERVVLYQMMTRLFGNTNQTNKPWGTIEENGVGKLNDISSKALNTLKKQGYTHIWYTGLVEHATLTDYSDHGIAQDHPSIVKGIAGSPYAIKDYYDINPDLAVDVPNRLDEFKALVKRTHDAEMKVIIDFVPNHLARQYKSDAKPAGIKDFGESDDMDVVFSTRNNFYYLPNTGFSIPPQHEELLKKNGLEIDQPYQESPAKVSGNDVFSASPSIYDWFETVKLNYGVDYQNDRSTHFDPIPDTWIKMKEVLSYWAGMGVDGFRCDMAEMVPVEFWEWVTNEITKDYPGTIFIAEIYNPNAYRSYINQGGFDYLYDKVEMYDTLKHIIQGKATTDDISVIWQRQEGIADQMLRFLENHDEQRIASPDFAGDMKKGIPMMAISAFMHQGPIMMYFGQDVGEPGQGFSGFGGDDGRTTIFDYWGVPQHIKWANKGAFDGGLLSEDQRDLQQRYTDILKASNEFESIRSGAFFDLHYYNRNDEYNGYSNQVYSFIRHTDIDKVLISVNLSESPQKALIKIPQHAIDVMKVKAQNIQVGNQKLSVDELTNYGNVSAVSVEIQALDYVILPIK